MKNKTQLLKEKYDKQLEEVSKTYYRISKIKSKIGFASDYISYLKNEIKKQQRLIEAHCYPVFTDLFGECDGKQKFLQKKKLKKIGTTTVFIEETKLNQELNSNMMSVGDPCVYKAKSKRNKKQQE